MIATAAAGPPLRGSAPRPAVDAGVELAPIGSRSPISPVEHTATSIAPTSEELGDELGGGVGGLEPSGPVQQLAPPELSTTAREPPVPDAPAAPQHRVGLERLAVKTAAASCLRAVVDDERHVRPAAGLEPGGRRRRPGNRVRGGDAHGATPDGRQAGGLGQAEGEVDALTRRLRCPW